MTKATITLKAADLGAGGGYAEISDSADVRIGLPVKKNNSVVSAAPARTLRLSILLFTYIAHHVWSVTCIRVYNNILSVKLVTRVCVQ